LSVTTEKFWSYLGLVLDLSYFSFSQPMPTHLPNAKP